MRNGWQRLIAFLILGIIVGGSGINLKIGKRIDELIIINKDLQEQLANTELELQQVRENLANKQNQVVNSIEVHVTFSKMDLTKIEKSEVNLVIEKHVREWLTIIQGENLEKLNYRMIPRIIDDRLVEAEGKEYKLKTTLVVVLEKVQVYIDAWEEKSNDLT